MPICMLDSVRIVKNSMIGKEISSFTGLTGNVGLTVGNNHNSQHNHGHSTTDAYSAAKEFVQDTHYSQSVDTALRGISEHSYRAHTEDGQRLMDGISHSYEQSLQARNDMQSSLNQAESYREAASLREEHADTINSNASQPYFEYLQKTQGGNLRQIEQQQTDNPAAGQTAGQAFMAEYSHHYLEQWREEHVTPEKVTSEYEQNNQHVENQQEELMSRDQANQEVVKSQAHSVGLGQKKETEASAKQENDKFMQRNERNISSDAKIIRGNGDILHEAVRSRVPHHTPPDAPTNQG